MICLADFCLFSGIWLSSSVKGSCGGGGGRGERWRDTQPPLQPKPKALRQLQGTCFPRDQGDDSSHLMFHHFKECAEIWRTLETVTLPLKTVKWIWEKLFPGFSTVYLHEKCQRQLPSQSWDSWEWPFCCAISQLARHLPQVPFGQFYFKEAEDWWWRSKQEGHCPK